MSPREPSRRKGGETFSSYYGRPILKEPVWTPEVPFYFFTGGLAGASAVLSLAARLAGNHRLARTSLYVGLAGEVVSPVLLVSDLGRPERFLNMFRVFKPSSPMNVGGWILGTSGGATTTVAVCERFGVLPRVKIAAEVVSAIAGAPLAVYTATLISDTAVPVWHEARRELPFIFAAASAASAGAAATLFLPSGVATPARRLAVAGIAVGGVASVAMERRLGYLADPYHDGESGRYARLSTAALIAGASLLARRGRKSRTAAVIGSSLILGGEVALRWSIFKAGFQSARDPEYTVRLQRERLAKAAPASPAAASD